MKSLKETALSILAKAALHTAKANVNSTCASVFHQPKVPNSAKQLLQNKSK